MIVIGVTGPSGAGKSLFCKYINELGLPMIDADEVYHSLLVPPSLCLKKIKEVFGDSVFNPDGTLDRKALGAVVFNSKDKLELLNKTVLGFVLDRIREMISELEVKKQSVVFVDAPTLIESGFHLECDRVISILAKKDVRVERIALRDDLTREKALERVNAQKSDDFYISNSDHILENDGDADAFKDASLKLLKTVLDGFGGVK